MGYREINLWTNLQCHTIQITERETLEDLRRRITPSIISENANSKWRFIYQVIEIDPRNVLTIPYDDAVFGISMESKVKVVDFVEGRNTIYMANVNKAKPDLIGLKREKFVDKNLEVFVFKNNDLTPNKFQPVLLERVRALKKESIGYNNVLVCEEGTAIEIQINAFSRGGIGYSLKSDGGDHIVDNLYVTAFGGNIKCSIKRYQSSDSAIVVSSMKGTTINESEQIKHSHITLDVWIIFSYLMSHSDPMPAPPKRTPSHELPSDAIANATIVEGQPTGVIHQKATHFGQNRDEKIGTVGIDLFVFKSIEAANKVFQINATIKT